MKIDKVPLEGCLKILNTLYDGWKEAVKELRREGALKEKDSVQG